MVLLEMHSIIVIKLYMIMIQENKKTLEKINTLHYSLSTQLQVKKISMVMAIK